MLVRLATSPATGPATPKHAEAIDDALRAAPSRNAEIMSGRPEKSSVRNVRTTSARGRGDVRSNTPSRVDVPPTSPASTFVIDNRVILLHLDAVSPVCQNKRRSRACIIGSIVTPATPRTGCRLHRQAE